MAGVTTPASPTIRPSTVRWRTLRTLLWLRWKLLQRGYSRSPSRIIGSILLLIVVLLFVGSLALGLSTAFYYLLPGQVFQATNILFYVLTGIYIFWAVSPLLQFSLNESLDITKLALYPVSQSELMIGLLFSTLLDVPTLAVLLTFISISVAWAPSLLAGVVIGVTLLLAYMHTIALSQLLLSSLMGLLRSRRWRDLSLVVATLLGTLFYLGTQVLSSRAGRGSVEGLINFINIDIGVWLQFIPPGMATRAIAAIYTGDATTTVIWMTILAITIIPVFWAWSTLLARSLVSAEGSGGRARQKKSVPVPAATATHMPMLPIAATGTTAARTTLIPAPIIAMTIKDFRYYWRDPQFKRLMISAFSFAALLFIYNTNGRGGTASWFLYLGVLTIVQSLAMNAFGYEGTAMTTLSIFPIRPAYLLIGKNIAVFVFTGIIAALLIAVQAFTSQNIDLIPINAIVLLGMIIVALGAGNVLAVMLPARVVRTGLGRQQTDAGTSFLTGLARFFASLLAIVLALPVVAAAFLPRVFGQEQLVPILLSLAIVYAIILYAGTTAIAASQYYRRLPKIIEVVTRE